MTLAVLLLMAGLARAAPDLTAPYEAPPGAVFQGLGVSAGPGRPVTARLTFDRRKAEAGGFIYLVPRLTDDDLKALAGSEALVTLSGGCMSRAAAAARRRGVPALILGSGRFEAGAVLVLERPVFGPPRPGPKGMVYQAVERRERLELTEGMPVTVDVLRGRLIVPPPSSAEDALAAAEAARAYDGLRDSQALLHWLEGRPGPGPAGLLLSELAERAALDVSVSSAVARLRQAALASFDAARLIGRHERRLADFLDEARASLREAGSPEAVRHLADEARARAQALAALAKALDVPLGKAAAGAGIAALVEKRLAELRGKPLPDSAAAAAAAAGASVPERVVLGSDIYRGFIKAAGLGPSIERTALDASLSLNQKSERIRALLLSVPLGSALTAEVSALLPAAARLRLSGSGESLAAVPRQDAPERLREVWAAYWDRGSLGKRKRQGLPLEPEAAVTVSAEADAAVFGRALSRDPASGRRERITVQAGSDEYTLERATGQELLPASRGAARRVLSPSALLAVARLCRALDSHAGRGVEVEFAVGAGDRLIFLDYRPMLEESAPAAAAPFSLTPQAPAALPMRSLP